MSLLPVREKVAEGRMRGPRPAARHAPSPAASPHPLLRSDLSRNGRGDTIMSLLPRAGEGGRRPDEGATSRCQTRALARREPSPAAPQRPLPERER